MPNLLAVFFLMVLPFSQSSVALADVAKPDKADPAPAAAATAIDAPALSATAKTALAKVNKRLVHIRTDALKVLLKDKPATVVIDVRNPEELTLRWGLYQRDYVF